LALLSDRRRWSGIHPTSVRRRCHVDHARSGRRHCSVVHPRILFPFRSQAPHLSRHCCGSYSCVPETTHVASSPLGINTWRTLKLTCEGSPACMTSPAGGAGVCDSCGADGRACTAAACPFSASSTASCHSYGRCSCGLVSESTQRIPTAASPFQLARLPAVSAVAVAFPLIPLKSSPPERAQLPAVTAAAAAAVASSLIPCTSSPPGSSVLSTEHLEDAQVQETRELVQGSGLSMKPLDSVS